MRNANNLFLALALGLFAAAFASQATAQQTAQQSAARDPGGESQDMQRSDAYKACMASLGFQP